MNPNIDPTPAVPKQRFWQNLGGGSLSISLILHLFLLAGGVVWVLQVIPEAEKDDVDFTTRSGGPPASALRDTQQRANDPAQSLAGHRPRRG